MFRDHQISPHPSPRDGPKGQKKPVSRDGLKKEEGTETGKGEGRSKWPAKSAKETGGRETEGSQPTVKEATGEEKSVQEQAGRPDLLLNTHIRSMRGIKMETQKVH